MLGVCDGASLFADTVHLRTYNSCVPLSQAAIMSTVNRDDVYNTLRSDLPQLIETFMNLPLCEVWVPERHLYKILGLKSIGSHGPYHALSCILSTIKKGKGGNSKKNTHIIVDPKYACCTLEPSRSNTHNVAFQQYGSDEYIDGGRLRDHSVTQKTRWFRFGPSTCSELSIQLTIVADAIGSLSIEMSDSTRKRRQNNFKNFYLQKEDGGYARSEIPSIGYKYYEQLPLIFKTPLDTKFITETEDGHLDISRRAFNDKELAYFECILRKMLVMSTIHGNLRVSNGDWVESLTDRVFSASTGATTTPRASSTQAVTPATTRSGQTSSSDFPLRRTNSTEIPDPLRYSLLGMLLFGLLLHIQLINLI